MKVLQVVAGQGVYRGPRPMTSGDWDTLQLTDFGLVLNLESGVFERSHDRLNEEFRELVSRGITPCHLEMGDLMPPSTQDMKAAVRLLRDFTVVNKDRNAYVHCLHGVDRTGVICAAWSVYNGRSVDEAIEEMLALGFHRWAYWWWLPKVRQSLTEFMTDRTI